MKPILTSSEMAAVDRRALEHVSIEELIDRAGTAVARQATSMLGAAYGRRVVVVAGRGHNGDDGRVAAKLLARRGAKVEVVDVGVCEAIGPEVDLVIDAAYGTGFHGSYDAPRVSVRTSVLAVDLPSGLGAEIGDASDRAVRATSTVTFGAYKPGLFFGSGPDLAGEVRLEEIGLDTGEASLHLVEDSDLELIPERPRETHKWKSALFVLAGSPSMRGAADLCVDAALRAGAGMVRTGSPGVAPGASAEREAVAIGLSAEGFARQVIDELARCKAFVAGPGLGTGDATRVALFEILRSTTLPSVLDADALTLLGSAKEASGVLGARACSSVLTPHDGEFARLAGHPPGADRLGEVRSLAAEIGAVVLLKGATTAIAEPSGAAFVVASGSPRLATAGSGDVLSGVIGALLARGLTPLLAAGLGAHLHGRAASRGRSEGLISGDLPDLVADALTASRR